MNFIKNFLSPIQSHLTYDSLSNESFSHHTSSPTPFKMSLSSSVFPLSFSTFSIHPNHQLSTSLQSKNSYTTFLVDNQKNTQFVFSGQINNIITKFTTLISQDIFSSLEFDIKNKTSAISIKNVQPAIKNTNLIVVNYLQNINKYLSLGTEIIVTEKKKYNLAFAARIENVNKILVVNYQKNYWNMSFCKRFNEMLSMNVEGTINNGISGRVGLKVKSKRAEVKFEVDSDLKSRINYSDQLLSNLSISIDSEIDKYGKAEYGLGFAYNI